MRSGRHGMRVHTSQPTSASDPRHNATYRQVPANAPAKNASVRRFRRSSRAYQSASHRSNADMAVYALAKSLAAKIEDPGPSVDIRRFSKRLAWNGAVSDAYLEDGDWRRVPVGEVLLVTGCAEEEPRLRALMEKAMWSVKDERRGRDA